MNGSEKTLSYGQGMQSCGRVTSTSFYRRIGKNLQRGHIRPPPPPPRCRRRRRRRRDPLPQCSRQRYTLFAQSDYSVPKTVHFLIKRINAKTVHFLIIRINAKTVHFLIKRINAKTVHHPLATEPRWIVPRSLFTLSKV